MPRPKRIGFSKLDLGEVFNPGVETPLTPGFVGAGWLISVWGSMWAFLLNYEFKSGEDLGENVGNLSIC